ncbi:hypothetical protein KKE26_09300 [bacterium]|nr:hypothetical protein [bacterium]
MKIDALLPIYAILQAGLLYNVKFNFVLSNIQRDRGIMEKRETPPIFTPFVVLLLSVPLATG